jgi:hypothetical protein
VRWKNSSSFGFLVWALCVGKNQMCLNVRLAKIVFKKVRWGKNKKHRVVNDCELLAVC